jgi:hypothetical protein
VEYGDDIRLILLLLLNAASLFAAWRLSRAITRDPVQRGVDTLLLWFAIQYAAVGIPGICRVLNPWSIGVAALLLSALALWIAHRLVRSESAQFAGSAPGIVYCPVGESARQMLLAAAVFVSAFSTIVIWVQRGVPVVDYDAITYHVPAAVHWLRNGRIDLLPLWFFNPANTFSPLAGSIFVTWWIAPLGNDALSIIVQGPPLLLLFAAAIQMGRAVGLPITLAAMLATALSVCRPFNSELTSARDDIYLAAFIATALCGCSRDCLRDRLGPIRLGLAIGLAAATKYTFLISAPLLLLACDAPLRAGWKRRDFAMFFAIAGAVALPWYLRNLWLTGNPLYPLQLGVFGHTLLPGLFQTLRSERLSTWSGIHSALIAAYHAPSPVIQLALLIGWLAAIVGVTRGALRQPLVRVCLLGFPLCTALFIFQSPNAEVRFLFPSLITLFLATGMALQRWIRWQPVVHAVAAMILLYTLLTTYNYTPLVVQYALAALLVVAMVLGMCWIDAWLGHRLPAYVSRARAAAVTICACSMLMWIYVDWRAYLLGYQTNPWVLLQITYPKEVNGWRFVADQIPADATIAYTNTYRLQPLFGYNLRRRLVYVPPRREVSDFLNLPHFPRPLAGESIEAAFTKLLNAQPDESGWLGRLRASGAGYLFVTLDGPDGVPPEVAMSNRHPEMLEPIYTDAATEIYRIR